MRLRINFLIKTFFSNLLFMQKKVNFYFITNHSINSFLENQSLISLSAALCESEAWITVSWQFVIVCTFPYLPRIEDGAALSGCVAPTDSLIFSIAFSPS